MALEAVVFPQDLFGCDVRELHTKGGEVWRYDFGGGAEDGKVCGGAGDQGGRGLQQERKVADVTRGTWDTSSSSIVQASADGHVNSSSLETGTEDAFIVSPGVAGRRRKRRRLKSLKNQEEVENQRMAHIAVERNRRKQINEYLAVLRSLMPASYVRRGDQASIVGGAIDFVKRLEKLVHSLEVLKTVKQRSSSSPSLFADFFSFPQYSSTSPCCKNSAADGSAGEPAVENHSPVVAEVEVTTVETHANLKVLSTRRPKQLQNMVVGLQGLHLTTLHLNVTTIDDMVLYSFSLKVEDECLFTSADEIATAVHQMVAKIQQDAAFDCSV
ncbi:hypothetical protein OPV22_025666 [Ensete ventricosum]|uniref:BHLH domain-containing protein n=1 Tax=Ensete ventricosum TaxID=4639 RepID=A0AAV8QJZ6_ENSVE|nr:hypothetical protein OPV22_025666 [Ensete ventricosum]